MRITGIARLRDGIFRDFKWSNDLPEFGQFNLIYGWNGTGKTILSRTLRCLENQTNPSGEVEIRLDGGKIKGEQFSNENVPIRVFNREFIDESVFPVDGGKLSPIFVLGIENVEKQKEVERLKEERADAQTKRNAAHNEKQNAERNLDNFCKQSALEIKNSLRSSDYSRYNNYDKSNFQDDTTRISTSSNSNTFLLSDEEKIRLQTQCRATPKQKVSEIKYTLPDFDAIISDLSVHFSTAVVSDTIEALKANSALSDWTKQGLELHCKLAAEQCLFCEQPLPKDRLSALENHFNTQYVTFIERLTQSIVQMKSLHDELDMLHLPDQATLYEELAEDYQTAKSKLEKALKRIQTFLRDVEQALKNKKSRAFERVSPKLKVPTIDRKIVSNLNKVIHTHNRKTEHFQSDISSSRDRLADGMVVEKLEEFERLRSKIEKTTNNRQTEENKLNELNEKIEKLERKIVEHRRPAEELNEDLQKYLGHKEIHLEIHDTGYMITRNGIVAQSLSEGEMTAIAVLYFLKALQDRTFDRNNGIVVLDDPVSSLDANSLYLAYGFIQDRTKNVGQLFILTHNFTFFRQVRRWFNNLNRPNRKKSIVIARFYMLDCKNDQNGRCTSIRELDPLLRKYDSEYHYLFASIYRASSESGNTCLEQNYVLPNLARRLLETFLAFRLPQFSGNLSEQMGELSFDRAKKLRILRFLHTHSHSSGIGELEHDPSILSESKHVLNDLLALIKSEDDSHYLAMVQLVTK